MDTFTLKCPNPDCPYEFKLEAYTEKEAQEEAEKSECGFCKSAIVVEPK